MSRLRGFTLIELLVVIAIIAVLVALLIPVTGKMRTQSNTTDSLSNLRQIGTAVFLFAADNNGRVPNGWGYELALKPYLGDAKQARTVFTSRNADKQPITVGSAVPITYSVHARVFDINNSSIGVPLSSIRRPSRLILVADGNQAPGNNWQANWHFENPWTHVHGSFDNYTEDQLRAKLTNDSTGTGVGPDNANDWAGWFRYCNNGAVNVLMGDGHTESIKKGEVCAGNLVAY